MKLSTLVKQRKEQTELKYEPKAAKNEEAIEVQDTQKEEEPEKPAPEKKKTQKKVMERLPDECDPPKKMVQRINTERQRNSMSRLYSLSMKYIEETPPECRRCPSSDNTRSTVSTSSGSLGKNKPRYSGRRFLSSEAAKKPTFITRLFDCTPNDSSCASLVCLHDRCGAYGLGADRGDEAERTLAVKQQKEDRKPSEIVTKSMPLPKTQRGHDRREDEDDHASLNLALAELADKIEKVKTQDDPPDVLLDEIAELEKLVASIEQGHPELNKKKLESSKDERQENEDYPYDQIRQLNVQRDLNKKDDDASTISTSMSFLQESDPVKIESDEVVLSLPDGDQKKQS